MKKRSVTIAGHSSSITLEDEFWAQLKLIAKAQQKSVSQIISEIDNTPHKGNLSSTIRIFVLQQLQAKIR